MRSLPFLDALHRHRRNHKYYDNLNNRYNEEEGVLEEEGGGYNFDASDKSNTHRAVNKWFQASDAIKVANEEEPLDLEMYRIKVAKPRRRRKNAGQKIRMMTSKLNRIRALEQKLGKIEEIKKRLNQKVWELEEIKEEERRTKKKIENEIADAEREWKYHVDRINPGSYKPLDRLVGDSSHLF